VLHTDHACQDAVVRYASERVAQGEVQVSLSTGPYCNARQRLPLGLVERLGKMVGERLQDGCAQGWRWRGRSVKIVDGTTVTMPDTEDNQAQYPQHGKQKPGLGFPIARLVALVSLGCGAVLDWAMGPCKGKLTGEDALFRLLYGSLVKGDIVLADRYHCGYFTVAMLYLMGVDVLTRQHARRTFGAVSVWVSAITWWFGSARRARSGWRRRSMPECPKNSCCVRRRLRSGCW